MTAAPALTSRRAAAVAGARPPRRPLAVRLAAQLAAAGMLAAAASGCGSGGAGGTSAAPGNVFRARQQITLRQAERAIGAVYRSHPAIGAFTVQDVQYTASSWRAIWRKCAGDGTAASSPAVSSTAESGQVIACAPLIFFLYSYSRKAAVPASAAAAGDVYWYAVSHIGGPASARTSLDELLRSWKLPVRPLTAAQARSAAAASVVTAARNAILAQRSVHLVINGRKTGGTAAERIVADIGAAAGTESIRSGAAMASIRVTTKAAFFTGNGPGLSAFIGLSRVAARKAAGHWVAIKAGTSEYRALAAEDTMPALPGSILPGSADSPRLRSATIAGRKVYVLDWTTTPAGSATTLRERLILTAARDALPVSETTTSAGGSQTVTLSGWGRRLAVRAPRAAIPYSRLRS